MQLPFPTTCYAFATPASPSPEHAAHGYVHRRITALRIRFHRWGLHALHSRAFLRRKVVQRQQRDHRQGQSAACMTKTDTAPRYCPSCLHVHPSRPGRGTIAIASPDNK
ncbi:hypothetical protein XPR_0278 [Xanthomonas arboricola pv. pruni MAFF 301420]|uniref:Uncharacterized protein n=2 Tax=Xanthomonas arboricola pv. pruni TaxID=69929 RepID=W4SBT5_9XANT|nr:hypothetical protein XPU_0203 [Xanthomonas arboricola pv. pruni str. MAFF 311562]GAE53643.1 hypothetical protein XPR_0278 [Xanthomonas arboricola pv. pruni MAFF 301420]GAE59122.1 hypothetical protein XPN_1028 [Xanthomonas arboricola pv. pruni MAFF 301427]